MPALRLLSGWVLLLAAPLLSCSHMPESSLAPGTSLATSQTVSALADPHEQARRMRMQRGDTASLHHDELVRYLPERIDGFVREGKPQGESVRMGGVSYSTCEQSYRRGKQLLKVQVVDYNGAQALFAGATALMTSEIGPENDEQLMRGCDLGLPGVRGYETVQKMEHRAAVALGIGERFFVSVESTGQEDTKFVKAVARTLDLRGLAAM
jgi:hypothetical protein